MIHGFIDFAARSDTAAASRTLDLANLQHSDGPSGSLMNHSATLHIPFQKLQGLVSSFRRQYLCNYAQSLLVVWTKYPALLSNSLPTLLTSEFIHDYFTNTANPQFSPCVMYTSQVIRPLLRQAPRAISHAPRRFLNTDTAPVLYSAHARTIGARNGHVEGSEGLKMDLGMPKGLGGAGGPGKTNPEELFAAGYGACFQSAMNLVAPKMGVKMPSNAEDSVVETTVHMVGDLKKVDLGIRVEMVVKVKGVGKEDLEKLVEKTKETCPYSRATQGNVTTNIKVESL
ncbi:OsmC family protein [Cordyceps militaris]|uniref:OsmC family protein n=1 Tax=Cordyceps militaris TaxID=73501 RepID=A0A2H4S8B1_CORMI|nr:OsmC family protein [Cordyceps militaris]